MMLDREEFVDQFDSSTWIDDRWHFGSPSLIGPSTHAFLFCSTVFDGARAFEGVVPDLDLHCKRLNESAEKFGLKPTMRSTEIFNLSIEGVLKFPENSELYIQPMYWAEEGKELWISPNPESTRFLLYIFKLPMIEPVGFSITKSRYIKPSLDSMPVDSKAGCLYPNNGRALREASALGFENCLMCDSDGNVAELASANIFLVKNGVVKTPLWNGTFLNGITRRRVISLLRKDGIEVCELALKYEDFLSADEIFSTGNASKVLPVTRIDDLEKRVGPVFERARQLYWSYAHENFRCSDIRRIER